VTDSSRPLSRNTHAPYSSSSAMRLYLLLGILLTSCSPAPTIEGPGIDAEATIVKIIVEPLNPRSGSTVVWSEPDSFRLAHYLFSRKGWEKSDRRLIPHYRIQIFTQAAGPITYWIGTFSDPPRFPCYQLCSGYWLASSSSDGQMDRSLFRVLASSGEMLDVGLLLFPKPSRQEQP
jgi:hypothetical protein